MFIYAQLDKDNYCEAVMSTTSEIIAENIISIELQDNSYLNRKYDKINEVWTDECREVEPIPPSLTLEDVNENIKATKTVTVSTEGTVTLSADDVLTLLEIQLENQDMLFKIMTHLGI